MTHAPPPMQPPYPSPPPMGGMGPDPLQKTADNVRLLGILTWIYAGLEALGLLFGLAYAGLGVFFITNPPGQHQPRVPELVPSPDAVAPAVQSSQGISPEMLGWIFLGIGGCTALFTGVLMVLSMMSARDLMRHRRRVFCIVVAGLHCLNFPLGMVLGIFTIIVLCKPEGKALFERSSL